MENKNSEILTGVGLVTAGLAIGVALGLICAPQTGRETRKQLAEYSGKILFRLRWLCWSPEEKYRYLWNRTSAEKNP